jgi:xanthine/uracil permease
MQIHEHVGHAGLVGWREKAADLVAPRAAKHGPVSEDQARAIIGGVFFAGSVYYVVSTLIRALKRD